MYVKIHSYEPGSAGKNSIVDSKKLTIDLAVRRTDNERLIEVKLSDYTVSGTGELGGCVKEITRDATIYLDPDELIEIYNIATKYGIIKHETKITK